VAWRPHRARRQRARLCLSRLDWPCLVPPALAAGRQSALQSAPPRLVPAGLCWPGPPPSLERAALCPTYYAVDSCYNSGTTRPPNTRLSASRRVHPPPSPRALSRAHTKPLARARSLSLPFCTTPPAPETATHGLDFPHKLPWLSPFHAIDCHPLRPPRTCQLGPANRPPAKPPPAPPACHLHATSMPPTFPLPFPCPFSLQPYHALPYRLAWKSSREMPLLSHMLRKIPPCSYSANGLSSSAICPASMTQMRS
jgi:hypothetical protein